MKAAILAIGSELLGTERVDTNSLFLTSLLRQYGVSLVAKSVIGDREEDIADELRRRMAGCPLILVTGGLGPTADDRTRGGAARALDRSTHVDERLVEHIRELFARFGRVMPEVNRRQAEIIDGAVVLNNELGSAPGQLLQHDGGHIFLFPGVPRELKGMARAHLEPWLRDRLVARAGGDPEDPALLESYTVKVACRPESEVEERIAPVYRAFGHDAVAVLASPGDVKIQLSAFGRRQERLAHLRPIIDALEQALGSSIYHQGYGEGRELDASLEAVVGRALGKAGLSLVTAESCTGGMVAQRLTRIPGSSAWFEGGVVSYSYALKTTMLNVSQDALLTHGAVSEEVAMAMARGARQRYGADLAISITGIAGPGGATPTKPVGTVHLALAGPENDDIRHWCVQFPGDRDGVRDMTAQFALDRIRLRLEDMLKPAAH